jgi:hypothetical protein
MLSFGHLYNLLGQKVILGLSVGYMKLLLVYFIVYAVLIFIILRAKKINPSIFLFGNIIGAVLLIFNLYPVLAYNIQMHKSTSQSVSENPINAGNTDDSQPDIYYIVLDAYARADIIQEVTGYDNTSFIDALKARGFYIPECAFSNYEHTGQTITSVLNYEYLNNLKISDASSDDTYVGDTNLIINNNIRKLTQSNGYQFVTGRGFDSNMDINNSDLYFNYAHDQGGADDLDKRRFSSLYFNTTVLRVISEVFKGNPEKAAWLPYWLAGDSEGNAYLENASYWFYQNNYMFDSLASIPSRPGKYFVYAHIVSPHPPYVYRTDGSFNYPLDSGDERVLYAETIQHLNKLVLNLVDTLQSQSDVQPIIIIQGDHAIHGLTTALDKHKILSAFYLPGDLNTPPYATITPVNDFRLVVKNYFDPSMQLLPDTLYIKNPTSDEVVAASCNLTSQ